jgi:hypothetical protein
MKIDTGFGLYILMIELPDEFDRFVAMEGEA